MNDLDALLKELDQSKKPKDNLPQPASIPSVSALSKYDSPPLDDRRGYLPKQNFSYATDAHRPVVSKPTSKAPMDPSFDLDELLQGASNHSTKGAPLVRPAKNSATSMRRDSLTEWLNDERLTTKPPSNQPLNLLPAKRQAKVDLDDLFADSNARNPSASRAPLSTTKSSAKQYYLDNSRYKPGKGFVFIRTGENKRDACAQVSTPSNQHVTTMRAGFSMLPRIVTPDVGHTLFDDIDRSPVF